jgi:protein O-GlcNAc transferase
MSTTESKLIKTQIDEWTNLARAGNYSILAERTVASATTSIQGCLWHSRALRALGAGEQANNVLKAFASRKTPPGSIAELSELAEEYLQCQMFRPAAMIATALDNAGAPQGHYLWSILTRETEKWPEFNERIRHLRSLGEPWASLSTIQAAWADIRRGKTNTTTETVEIDNIDTEHPGIIKLKARIALARRAWDDAARLLHRAAILQPMDWEWRGLFAVTKSGKYVETNESLLLQQALQLYHDSLKLQPRQAELYLSRARLYVKIEKYDQADQDLLKAIEIKPWNDAVLILRLQVLGKHAKYIEALDWLSTQRKRFDTAARAGAHIDLMIYSGSKPKQIEISAKDLTQKFKHESGAWRTAGAALQRIKKLDDAARCYETALRLNPSDTGALNNLALLYRDRGDAEKARQALAQIDINSDSQIRLNYAFLCLQIGEIEEAEAHLRALAQIMPKHGGVMRGLAEVALAREKYDEARDLAERSNSIDRTNPLAWITLAGVITTLEGDIRAIDLLKSGEEVANPVLPVRMSIFSMARRTRTMTEMQDIIGKWIEADPQEVQYRIMAAEVAQDACRFETAERHLRDAREIDEEVGGQALFSFYVSRERFGTAETLVRQLTLTHPTTMKHWGGLAEILYLQGKPSRAIEALDKGLSIEPGRLSLIRQKAGMLLALERYDDAVQFVAQFNIQSESLESLQLYLDVLSRAHRLEEQCSVLETATKAHPTNVVVQIGYARALERTGQREKALMLWMTLSALYPRNFTIMQQHVQALVRADRVLDATELVKQYSTPGDRAPVLTAALAELLRTDGLTEEAKSLLDEAIPLHPDHLGLALQRALLEKRADAYNEERMCWLDIMKRFPIWQWFSPALDAVVRLDLDKELEHHLNKWLSKEPKSLAPRWAAFKAARELKRLQVAERILNKIAEIQKTPSIQVTLSRVSMWSEEWRLSDSVRELTEGLRLWPSSVEMMEMLINIKVKSGDYENFDELFDKIKHLMGDRQYTRYQSFFFNINCHPDWSAEKVADFYKKWYINSIRPILIPPPPYKNARQKMRRLRVGYLSPDFRRHAVAYFTEPMLIGHDRENFEIFAYAHLDPGQADSYTARFKTYTHHWIETRGMGDVELARRIRDDEIDILIDLAGHTTNNRLGVMMHRPAPVQATSIIGAGQTTGIPEIGYLLTDQITIPTHYDHCYAESVVRLPIDGIPYRPPDEVPEPTDLPCLKNNFITFGVVARPLRTNTRTLFVWARILKEVPNSILRFDHRPYIEIDLQDRLLKFFVSEGIDVARIEFRNSRPHWHAYHDLDIKLDPFPAGSGTTVTECIYMNRLPISLKARPPMGYAGYAQLKALGLDEVCVADTEDGYVQKAIELASDLDRLVECSSVLRQRMRDSPLMDYQEYGRKLASSYREMWIEWCNTGKPMRVTEWG